MAFSRLNGGTAYTADDDADAAGYFEPNRKNVEAAIFERCALGGSRVAAIEGVGYVDAHEYRDFVVPDIVAKGGVYKAIVECRVEDASIAVTPKIRNVTDSTDAVVGTPTSSVTWAAQVLSFTPTVGKTFRLMFTKDDDTFLAWGMGELQRTAV